jgi:hypothetical protein
MIYISAYFLKTQLSSLVTPIQSNFNLEGRYKKPRFLSKFICISQSHQKQFFYMKVYLQLSIMTIEQHCRHLAAAFPQAATVVSTV